ncbi:MAG: 5-formyltetrahydrofolate cyclo-ligase [Lachnospiraceae bacterium]
MDTEKTVPNKKEIRSRILKIRNGLSEAECREKSGQIMKTFKRQEEYQNSGLLFLYASFGSEVMTRDFLQEALSEGKRIALPRAFVSREGPCMEFYEITENSQLLAGYKGIPEPDILHKDVRKILELPDLMLMPGVAFDKDRTRIGYGMGFYDRYLEKHPGIRTIAVAYACQVIETIPESPYDYRPDRLLTEERIY